MLAIIIPYFKLTFFDETLQSLANQTDQRFKVYIGDDASPEDCTLLLEKYREKFDFVYHRFERNLGGISLTKQWERCIALSRDEEWLMILGDDDVLGDTVVEEFYKQYDTFCGKTYLVRFATRIIFEETNTVSDIFTHPIWESATDSFYRKFEYITRSSLSEYVFSRASYSKYGFYNYPLAWSSDDRAWLDFSNNKPIFTINENVVFVRISKNSVSGKFGNIYQKDLAITQFYKYIISSQLKFYNKQQRKRLLDRYENSVKRIRTLYLSEWFLIVFLYSKYFDSYALKKVLKRFIKNVLKYET